MLSEILTSPIRLLFLMAAGVTVAAVCIGRARPDGNSERITSRPAYQVIGNAVTAYHGGGTHLLDPETSRLEPLALPPGVSFDVASVSPWEEDGRRQIVGIGWSRSGKGASRLDANFGLVRMSLPDGEVLDQLPLAASSLPASPPCWIPGTRAGVIYAGADGRIYRVDFASSHPDGGVAGASKNPPRPLAWPAFMPGSGDVYVRDLAWPDDARMSGRVLVSLRFEDGETGRYTEADQIWWLELNRGATSIIDAGRLLDPAQANGPAVLRFPNLVRRPASGNLPKQ